MRQEKQSQIADALRTVPVGGLTVVRNSDSEQHQVLLTDQFSVRTDGKGQIDAYSVYPGADASYAIFLASEVTFHHKASPSILEIFYCHSGRVGWNMREGTAIYLGAGDIAVHSAACCADSAMMFPLGYAEGISFSVDIPSFAAHCPEILREAHMNFQDMQDMFCSAAPMAIPACPELEGMFSPLYAAPPFLHKPYLQLKLQEIILYLMHCPFGRHTLTQYVSEQTELIKKIHHDLTEHLNQRLTIEELSKKYLINTSTLKEVFKAVYGLPIATYMKEYRIRKAMALLRETDATISEIAHQVGYSTQGKFSKSFRDITQMLPTEYRRNQRFNHTN